MKTISGKFSKVGIVKVPNKPCEYEFYNKKGKMMRNGKSCDCKTRLNSHLGSFNGITSFKARITNNCKSAELLEKKICLTAKPPLNKRCG